MSRINFDDITKVAGVEFVAPPARRQDASGAIVEHTMVIPVPDTSTTVLASLFEVALTDTRVPTQEFRVTLGSKTLDTLNVAVEGDVNPQDWLLNVVYGIIAKAQQQHHVDVR